MSPRHHGPHGGGPWGPPGPWGPGGPFGPGGNPFEAFFGGGRGHRRGGGRRVRRGGVRIAILVLLAEESRSGYEIIREGKERSRGQWNPSPGSVYPMLQQLEDEGLVRPAEPGDDARRRPFELTDEGRRYVEDNAEELVLPWEAEPEEESGGYSAYTELASVAAQLAAAAMQVTQAGTTDQVERAKDLLAETRRGLYRILAEDDTDDAADDGEPSEGGGPDTHGDGPRA
ncbi:PadR family transcriptional regulator [Murinocardiopsis flavida]